eukprot:scaffold14263_cov95-Skeletonema_menzelii.AAC.2
MTILLSAPRKTIWPMKKTKICDSMSMSSGSRGIHRSSYGGSERRTYGHGSCPCSRVSPISPMARGYLGCSRLREYCTPMYIVELSGSKSGEEGGGKGR